MSGPGGHEGEPRSAQHAGTSPAAAPLRGKAALVTGSAAGIGLEIALALASQGCAAALHGLEPAQQLQPQLEALQALGVPAVYHQVDLDDPAAIAAMVAATRERLGSLDVLVNNAVTRHFAPLEALPVAAWDKALAVNVSAAFHAVRLALPAMRERGWGRIVNMTSVYGERGTANRIDYVTSKAALAGMTRAIAAEVAGQGVTCNSVCPGSVLTPSIDARVRQLMTGRGLTREAATSEFLAGKQPGGQFRAGRACGAAGAVPLRRCGRGDQRRPAADGQRVAGHMSRTAVPNAHRTAARRAEVIQ